MREVSGKEAGKERRKGKRMGQPMSTLEEGLRHITPGLLIL